MAHLLKYDSTYGPYDREVSYDDDSIIVDGVHFPVYSETDPAKLPWGDLGVDVVIESTGRFVDPAKAHAHIDAGAKKVVLSAPAKGEGATTIVFRRGKGYDEHCSLIYLGSALTRCSAQR